ncbi:hypothetical protein [Streptomyces sp. NPDC049949]|uniref:hypothetical protein n=1 Tax=Streptomyces sp. NPDC049949 TaxID=3154627 RepID=UPI0034313AAC
MKTKPLSLQPARILLRSSLAELAYKLERALEQIDELQERVDRLERGQPSGAEAG